MENCDLLLVLDEAAQLGAVRGTGGKRVRDIVFPPLSGSTTAPLPWCVVVFVTEVTAFLKTNQYTH
jgi:hypothetical protein